MIDQGQQPTNTLSNNPRFNLKETEVKQWTEAFTDTIDKHQNTFTNLTNINLSQSQAEEAAITIQESLIEATHKTAKIACPSEKQNCGGTLKYNTHSRLPVIGKLKLSKRYMTLTQSPQKQKVQPTKQ
jgi:hypothetical protein